MNVAAPWTGRDRQATAAVAVQFAINGAITASFVPRLPELRDEIGVSTTAIGVLLTVASASGLAASAMVQRVIARATTRRVLLIGGIALGGSLALVGLATTWIVALIGLACVFYFDVYVDVAMNMQGSWLSARRSRPMINRLHGLWSVGAVIGGLAASSLAGAGVSLRVHLCGAAAVLVILSTLISLRLLPTDERHADEPEAATADRPSTSKTRTFGAGFAAVVLETAGISWAAFRITDDLHGSTLTAGLAYAAVVGGMTIGRFGGDHLDHRYGSERLMRTSAWIAMVGLVAAGVLGVEALCVAMFLVAGLGIATLMPRLYDSSARRGALGVLTAGTRTGTLVVPTVIATIASASSIGVAIAVAGIAAGVGFQAATRTTRAA